MTMRSDKWILRNFNNHVKYNIIDSGARFRTKFSGLEKDKDQFEILGSSLPTFFYGRPPTEEDYKRQRDIINRALLPLHGTNPESSIMFNECSISIAADSAHAMISPFHGESVKYLPDGRKIPSYGLSSYGYDIRLGRHFKVFRRDDSTLEEIDLLGFKEAVLVNDHKDVDDFVLWSTSKCLLIMCAFAWPSRHWHAWVFMCALLRWSPAGKAMSRWRSST